MSRQLKRRGLSSAFVKEILSNNGQMPVLNEPVLAVTPPSDEPKRTLPHRNASEHDYLTTPAQRLSEFLQFARDVKARYENDQLLMDQYNDETNDMLHYIELLDLNAASGYRAYKRLSEIRRERRICKEEMEILQPLYDFFNQSNATIDEMQRILGICRKTSELIENRVYTARTKVIDDV